MWSNNTGYGGSLIYFFLIVLSDDDLNYRDIDDMSIEITKPNNIDGYQYRIDIKSKYKIHNFWLFNDDNFDKVATYVKTLVESRYKSITKSHKILNITKNAYFDRVPPNMYDTIEKLNRNKKLKKLKKL